MRKSSANWSRPLARPRFAAAGLLLPAAMTALLLAGAGLVLAVEPDADFSFEPAVPEPNETITFTPTASDPDGGTIQSIEWDFGDGGGFVLDEPPVEHAYDGPGERTVTMKVTDSDGEQRLVTKDLRVNAPPDAGFDFAPTVPIVGGGVSFDASSSADDLPIPADGYVWDLDGDGTFGDAVGAQVSRSYDSPGSRTVSLRVTDSDGAVSTASEPLRVNSPPVADFTFSPPVPLLGRPVEFESTSTDDRSIVSYDWELDGDADFDDAHGQGITHTFLTAGPRDVSLRVTDDDGVQSFATKSVTVNRRPLADFGFEPPTPSVGESIAFTSRSSDPDGDATIVAYEWELDGDDDFNDAAGPQITHSYATPGQKTVRLRVTDSGGAISLVRDRKVLVQVKNPEASFTFAPGSPVPGQTVSFQSTSVPSEGATITAQEWDLDGDGQFDDAQGSAASAVFATAGPKPVSLRVTDGNGFDIYSQPVVVNAPPVAALRFSPATPLTGDTVELTSLSVDPDGPIASEAWDLDGDGAFDDGGGRTASRSFAAAGAYSVGLRVTDANGVSDVESVAIDVGARPRAPRQRLALISPFPVVRIAGRAGRRGTRIRFVSVRARSGALVAARCRGKSCPARPVRRRRSKGRAIRLRWLERRLRVRTRIAISVTYPGRIGSYTVFKIRRLRRPLRRDLCLEPSRRRPTRCPSE